MKKIILVVVLIIASNLGIAQCWQNPNTLTTHWESANTSNYEKWNWTIPGNSHNVYLKDNMDNPSIIIELPYFCSNPLGSGNCGNINTYPYELIPPGEQDIYPENGWELVLKNFGTPNSSPGANDGQGTDNPVFILYNRYTGKMKVYLAAIGKNSANSAYLEISFEKNSTQRGLFTHANTIAKTLVEFDEKAAFKSLNDYAVKNFDDDYYWLVSEIQTAYDPCTCTDLGTNSIEVRPWLINTSTIDATIEGTASQQMMTSSGVVAQTDATTAFFDKVTGTVDQAIKGYTTYSKYAEELNKMLDKSNSEYKNKLVKEWFDDFVKNNPQYQGVTNLPDKYALWDALGKTDDEFKKSIGMSKIDEYQKGDDYSQLKSIASFIPYVGSAIGIIDFLMNGGKKEPTKPSPPMVFNVSLKLTGTISTQINKPPVVFFNPGYKKGPSSNLTPIYNNILGVFNVLRPPAMSGFEIKNFMLGMRFFNTNNEQLQFIGVKLFDTRPAQTEADLWNGRVMFKQFKLDEDIKYVLNPAANVEVTMIDACFVFEYDNTPGFSLNNAGFATLINSPAYPWYNGLFSPSLSLTDRIERLKEQGMDLEYQSADNTMIRIRTKYVPLTCLRNVTFTLFNGKLPKTYVKLLIKYKRKDDPNAENITQIVTYDLGTSINTAQSVPTDCQANAFVNQTLANIQDQGNGIALANHVMFSFAEPAITCFPLSRIKAPGDATYMEGASDMSVNGTIFIPTNTNVSPSTTLKAKSIVLGDNLTINDGVKLISETDIIMTPESQMHPNSIIKTAIYSNLDLWSCPDVAISTLEASNDEIDGQLCSNSAYKGRVLAKTGNIQDLLSKNASQPRFDFSLHPNPALNNVSLVLSSDIQESFTIVIVDIAGKQVTGEIRLVDARNESLINIDISELSNGAYFCSFSNDKGVRVVKKFVVAR